MKIPCTDELDTRRVLRARRRLADGCGRACRVPRRTRAGRMFAQVPRDLRAPSPCHPSGSIRGQANARAMPSLALRAPGQLPPTGAPVTAVPSSVQKIRTCRVPRRTRAGRMFAQVPRDLRAPSPCHPSGSIRGQANARAMPSLALRAPGQLPPARAPFKAAGFHPPFRSRCGPRSARVPAGSGTSTFWVGGAGAGAVPIPSLKTRIMYILMGNIPFLVTAGLQRDARRASTRQACHARQVDRSRGRFCNRKTTPRRPHRYHLSTSQPADRGPRWPAPSRL